MRERSDADLVVVGLGPAGLTAAELAVQLGLRALRHLRHGPIASVPMVMMRT